MNDYIQIAAAIAGIISAIIAILQYFKVKRRNSKLQKQVDHIASTGVAIGYYYNFVVDIYEKLKESKLKVEIYKDNTNIQEKIEEFDTDDVELHIIIPVDLQIKSMNSAIRKMQIHRKGNIISKGAKRNFGINFRYTSKNKIAILDFPKPLNAIREHMKNDPKFIIALDSKGVLNNQDIFESEKWKEQEKMELENFIATIKLLMKRGRIGDAETETKFINVNEIPDSITGT